MTPSMSLADLVRHLRLQARVSQEALAERAGLSTRTISDIESGVGRAPRAITLSLLGEALGASVEDREALRAAARAQQPGAAEPVEPLAPLVGREDELAALQARVARGVRLLTIVGPPGAGKTALAVHLARRLGPEFARIATVELAALAAPAAVPGAIAQALGARSAGEEIAAADVADAIGRERTLLVLDNIEHVAEAARFVGDLLAAAPALTIVATGRAPLRQSLEQRFALGPLAPDAAIELLAALSAATPDGRKPRDDASLAALAARLEGLPLAIELAAPLLRVLSPAALVRRLGHRLPLLAAEGDAGPERHRTMRDAIDWSYRLLGEDAQRAFRRLSVLRGAFTAETAQAIAEPARTTLDTLRVIAELVDHNLLQTSGAGDEPRFEFYAIVREYGEEVLHATGEHGDAAERLAQHCASIARLVVFNQPATQTSENLDVVAAESANCDRTLSWLRESGRTADALRLALDFYGLWWLRDPATGLRWFRALIADAEAAPEPLDAELLATTYVRATGLTETTGSLDAADALAEKALVLRRDLGNELGVAAILNGFGTRATARAAYDDARRYLLEGLEIRRRLGSENDVAMSLSDLAANELTAGDTLAAAGYLDDAIVSWRRVGSDLGISIALGQLGMIALREELFDRAEAFSREALAMAQTLGHVPTMAMALITLARLALRAGDLAGARAHAEAAIALYDTAAARGNPFALEVLAEIALAGGDAVAAARFIGSAAALRTRDRIPIGASERADHDRTVAAIRAALGAETFETERMLGAARGPGGA